MTSSHIGDKWVGELLEGHPNKFHNIFRMSKAIFSNLLHEIKDSRWLHGSYRTSTREVLSITLYILSHNESILATYEWFQHSSETISRYFSIGLDKLGHLAKNIVKPIEPTFRSIKPKHIMMSNICHSLRCVHISYCLRLILSEQYFL